MCKKYNNTKVVGFHYDAMDTQAREDQRCLLGGCPDLFNERDGTTLGVILGHAHTCPRQIFITLFASGSSDAASAYQSTVATSCLHDGSGRAVTSAAF